MNMCYSKDPDIVFVVGIIASSLKLIKLLLKPQ